ncbi:MAG: ABC transporter permease [Aquihabitans sp.]
MTSAQAPRTSESLVEAVGARSSISFRSLLHEAVTSTTSHLVRTLLTLSGTIVGVATLIAITGASQGAERQVQDSFDAVEARELTVISTDQRTDAVIPVTSGEARSIRSLRYVEQVGGRNQIEQDLSVRTDVVHGTDHSATVLGITKGYMGAALARIDRGRGFVGIEYQRGLPVALVGAALARNLQLADPRAGATIEVDGLSFSVVGIVSGAPEHPDLLSAVAIPEATRKKMFSSRLARSELLVRIAPGSAMPVGKVVGVAARPTAPADLSVLAAPAPRGLRSAVGANVRGLSLALALVALAIGAFGIANTTLIAVMERVPEFGLRRSLGATSRQVGAQVLAESCLLGALGGALGEALGLSVVAVIALYRNWPPLSPALLLVAAPILGTAIGCLAGLYPAWRASRIEPDEALRR